MKIPLLEYLDKLEATAKAADARFPGPWRACGDASAVVRSGAAVRMDHGMIPVSATAELDFILATQPKATLALIAKLREATDLLRQSAAIAAYPGVGAAPINRFQDDIVAWAQIEVPE